MTEAPDSCPVCERTDVTLTYAPDPFAEEINGNDTPVWQCADCAHESAMDI